MAYAPSTEIFLGELSCDQPHRWSDPAIDCTADNATLDCGYHCATLPTQVQWVRLRRALAAAGATVHILPFVHAVDSVFVRDSTLLTTHNGTRCALLNHVRRAERRIDVRRRSAFLEARGFTVATAPLSFNASDVVLLPGGRSALLGVGFRSSVDAVPMLERHLGCEVFPIPLVNPRLYHLEMALALLHDGTALVCAEALGRGGLRTFERAPGVEQLLVAPVEEAERAALSFVEIGQTIITSGIGQQVTVMLRRQGKAVRPVDLSWFHAVDGSVARLISCVHSLTTQPAERELTA